MLNERESKWKNAGEYGDWRLPLTLFRSAIKYVFVFSYHKLLLADLQGKSVDAD